MTRNDYLVLGMTAVWLVTNFLGAAFTVRRVYTRWKQQPKQNRDGRFAVASGRPGFAALVPEIKISLRRIRVTTKAQFGKVRYQFTLAVPAFVNFITHLIKTIANLLHN